MTAGSKDVYIDKLVDIMNEYNNKYQITIKMKPIELNDNICIDSIEEANDKDPKLKVGDHVENYPNIPKLVEREICNYRC